jgi:hypothetical protein
VLLADIGTRQLQNHDTYAAFARYLSGLENATGGKVLRNLEELRLSEGLALRIKDVTQRRNDLVHRPIETYGTRFEFYTPDDVSKLATITAVATPRVIGH